MTHQETKPVDTKKIREMLNREKGKMKRYDQPHVEVAECESDDEGLLDVHYVLEILYQRGVRKLLVEGGGTVIWSFLKNKVVDDLFIFIGPCIIGGKNTPTVADGRGIVTGEVIALKISEVQHLGSGVLIHYQLV